MSDQPEINGARGPRARATALLSKQGLVVAALANDLLRAEPGATLTRIQEYAERFAVSVGTVQGALRFLQDQGAAKLEMHGRLGSYVQSVDYPLLWKLALNQPISGAMPLPYSRRLEGIATGVRQQFERHALDLELRFTRGADQRLQELATKSRDWALVSRFAAETAIAAGSMIKVALLLGPGSYMGQRVLLLRPGCERLADNMRVGVDTLSTDHVYVVKAATQDYRVELVDVDYSQALRLLISGVIDATVWSQEDVPAATKMTVVPALSLQHNLALTGLNQGVIVVEQDDQAMSNLLAAVLDTVQLEQVAQEVERQLRRPTY